MPVKNKYQHYSLTNKQAARSTAVVSHFKGADLSSPVFNVPTYRAISIQNFIQKGEYVRKRNGYEEIFQVGEVEYFDKFTGNYYKNSVNFNGIWKFKAEDGNWHVVAHIGCLLFEIKNIENNNADTTIEPILAEASDVAASGIVNGVLRSDLNRYYKFNNYKSSAFVGGNKLWFLGGNKYMCLRFTNYGVKFYPVENSEDTFIPTTSIGISYNQSASQNREQLQYPNKLNYFRKNKLVSGVGKDNSQSQTEFYEYTLDAPLILNPNQTIDSNGKSPDIRKIYLTIRTRREG